MNGSSAHKEEFGFYQKFFAALTLRESADWSCQQCGGRTDGEETPGETWSGLL